MSRPSDDDPEAKTTTVLDKVRPTVVRRRVYEPTAAGPSRTLVHVAQDSASDDDDAGPPSSVNVARALASLRGDELKRLEEIVSADDDPASMRGGPRSVRGRPSSAPMRVAPPSVEAPPVVSETVAKPVLRLGPSIALADLALGLGVSKQDLVTALVTRGFFSLTVKSMLSRETARLAASMYGMATEDDDTFAESAVQSVGKNKKKAQPHDKPKPLPKPPTSKKPSPPKRSVNRGR